MDKSDINSFKTELYKGVVKFSYVKKDGTIREATGTMCSSKLPVETKMDTYILSCLEWETGYAKPEDLNLPLKLSVKIPADTRPDVVYETIMDAVYNSGNLPAELISCSFSKHERAPKKLPDGTIFYFDVDKNGYRSFNESQLLSGWTCVL